MTRAKLVACAALLLSGTASAAPSQKPAATKKPAKTITSPKRALPDYGALPPREPGRAALVVPRLVLLPPYLVWNYGIRKPLGALVSHAERNQWPTKILDFFTFGEERTAGIVPTALFDFGIKPSVGVYAFWNRLVHPDNSATFHFGTWGPHWLNITGQDRLRIGTESWVQVSGRFTQRPDMPFYGLGPRSLLRERVRYESYLRDIGIGSDMTPTSDRTTASKNEGADAPPARLFRVLTRVGLRSQDFGPGQGDGDFDDEGERSTPRDNDDMDMVRAIREGRLPEPPGFARGYTAVYERLDLQLDTRPRRPAKQSGFKLVAEAEHGADVRHAGGAAWMRWGGTAGVFWDTGKNRTLGLSATALFADPLRGEVPFTEQVTFGGATYMRGFLWNRLIGRSGAVATLEYCWPIWVFIDGTVQASLGNVFGAHLQDFAPKLLRFSGSIGIKTSNTPNQSFEAMFGVGSETIADGFAINSFRLVIGTNQF